VREPYGDIQIARNSSALLGWSYTSEFILTYKVTEWLMAEAL